MLMRIHLLVTIKVKLALRTFEVSLYDLRPSRLYDVNRYVTLKCLHFSAFVCITSAIIIVKTEN